MNWKSLKSKIEKEIELASDINKEPQDIMKLRLGVITSDAGSYDQYFSVIVSLYDTMSALGRYTLYNLLCMADEDSIELNTLNKMTKISFGVDNFEPTKIIDYLGIKNIHLFAGEALSVLDQLRSKEEYKELIGTYRTYVNIMLMHLDYIFPWPLGIALYKKTKASDIKLYREFLPIVDKIGYF